MAAACNRIRSRQFAQFFSRLLASRNAIIASYSTDTQQKIPSFEDERVKCILRKITGRDQNRIFAARKEKLVDRQYKLMTDEELLQAEREAEKRAEKLLEMPLVMEERKEINEVLEIDERLAGFDQSSFVFTDISTSVTDRTRQIVVRESSGKLRAATWQERDQMNFIYFPKEGRKFRIPEMLQDENLDIMFDQERHVDVLDLVCVQCEPDSADYVRVHHRTYKDLKTRSLYDLLRSTRHFGAMAFYFTRNRDIAGLLLDMVQRDLVNDAVELVKLHHLLHPDQLVAVQARQQSHDGLTLLKAFLRKEGPQQALAAVMKLTPEQDSRSERRNTRSRKYS